MCVGISCNLCISGDVAGIGWERSEGTPPPPGQPAKGRVYFTYCGQRLLPFLEDVSGGMWPVVHIQKKVTMVANFHLIWEELPKRKGFGSVLIDLSFLCVLQIQHLSS